MKRNHLFTLDKCMHLTFIPALFFMLHFEKTFAQFSISEMGASPVLITGGKGACGIKSADLDNDGKKDIVISFNSSSNVLVYKNNSTGAGPFNTSFNEPQNFALTSGSSVNLCITDLNNDGLQDIIIANNETQSINILQNVSSHQIINFNQQENIVCKDAPVSITTGDLDMDGYPEMIIAEGSFISIYKNSTHSSGNEITFSNTLRINLNIPVHEIKCADFDGDGMVDIISGSRDKISIIRNMTTKGSNNISFKDELDYATLRSIFAMEIGDLDGDYKPEIITANWPENDFSVFTNGSEPGNVSIDTLILFATTSPSSVTLGDFDQDGKFDVATMVPGNNSNLAEIYRNTSRGQGMFSFSVAQCYNPVSDKMIVDDFDGDGIDDFASISAKSNALSVWVHDNRNSSGNIRNFEAFCNEEGKPMISWQNTNESGIDRYIIEKTDDGNHFKEIASISAGAGEYDFTDSDISGNLVYYRLKLVDAKGSVQYSSLKELDPCEDVVTDFICVFPNPVDNIMNFHFSIAASIGMHFEVVDMEMNKKLEKTETLTPGTRTYSLDVSNLEHGNYLLSVQFGNLPPKICHFQKM